MSKFTDKTVIITGGGSGIGRAMSFLFAKNGANVHLVDLDVESANQVVEQINREGGIAQAHSCDVSDQDQVVALLNDFDRVDILINNAGISHIGRADNTSQSDFDRVYQVNVKGVYNMLYACLPIMKKQKGAVIINMASIAAHVGLTDRFAYSMSKGAIAAMTLSVARDYIDYNIRCNSISPARVRTPFVDGFIANNYAGQEEQMFKKLSDSQPIKRMAQPEEIAALALYLASEEASFITGTDYPIDGGFITLNN
ncbi:SDR family NAD(P)-dependent oxidoreductase [Albibacterium indicum]|uniref:SDR family NAD(P)-dependent oxidoreductase n=1 Tax=Albibacterium indicum TaxID=2292082 RepID=UPI000E544C9C|nr:SDR family oxidoreductase [Pedobacter indicus]